MVSTEEAKSFAVKINAISQIISTKDNIGINELFDNIGNKLFEQKKKKKKVKKGAKDSLTEINRKLKLHIMTKDDAQKNTPYQLEDGEENERNHKIDQILLKYVNY